MFNPCHLTTLLIAVVGLSRFTIFTEMLVLYIYSSAFGGWIGIIFSENEELTHLEIFVYYCEHFFTSFGGPLIFTLFGRFDPRDYIAFPYPVMGFHMFCLYMKIFLTPLSLMTWANLNHTLCGVDNDPFYKHFNMGEWYYLWADLYLLFSCYVGVILNLVLCSVCSFIFGALFGHKADKEVTSSPKKTKVRADKIQ